MPKKYSIGEFSSKVGVTPDLIKYYEKQGLLKPDIMNAGYRYYTTRALPIVNEIIKWKNIGFSAKNVVKIIEGTTFEQLTELLQQNSESVRRQIRYLKGVLEYIDELESPQNYAAENEQWHIGYSEDYYFLPTHTNTVLLRDARDYDVLHEWQQWMPIVRPVAIADNRPDQSQIIWGLFVPADFAKAQNITVSAPVEYIPTKRCLILRDKRLLPDQSATQPNDEELLSQMFVNVNSILKKHNLTASGPSHFIIQSKIREDNARYSYQMIFVPIE